MLTLSRLAPRIVRTAFLTALCATCLLSGGCSEDVVETEPEGGFAAFRDALASGDPQALWATLDPRLHEELEAAYQQIETTQDRITQLQASDRDEAREATGMAELGVLTSGYDLFAFVFQPERIPDLGENSRYTESLQVEEVALIDETRAVVLTRGEQEFELVRLDDGTWRVREPIATLVTSAVAPIASNLESVERAVRLFGSGADEIERMRRLGLVE